MVRVRHVWPAVLLIAAATARSSPGEQYWIAYGPSTGRFPEEQGWTRHFWEGGGALRYFEQGALVIDSRASISIYDYYDMPMNGHLDPDPGEEFVMRWRLRVDEVSGSDDQGAGFVSDLHWKVGFRFGIDRVYSSFEPGVSAHYAPGVFHDFELRTADLQRYTLYIDAAPAISGGFWHSGEASRVWWGDGVQGCAGLARWERFEFGVIPEAGSAPLIIGGACIFFHGMRRRTKRSAATRNN